MITFETQQDFEEAVVCAIMEKLQLFVHVRGDHFVNSVEVAMNNYGDVLFSGQDATS